jgi:hypothetical protein
MKSKQITINGVEITAHSDGSITKPFYNTRTKRTFGCKDKIGYMVVSIAYKTFHMHRIVAQAFLSDFSDFPEVDHIDGDKVNNDIGNLRMATRFSQTQAYRSKCKGCSSKYRGVSWNKRNGKWLASCEINGKQKYIGSFDCEKEAAIARDAYFFSQGCPAEGLNFPENHKTP